MLQASEIYSAIGMNPRSVTGILSSITRRARRFGYTRWFFDCRRTYPSSHEFEWRVRAREARHLGEHFEARGRRNDDVSL
ncbi:MAG: hypothetical protein JOZ81_08230 [Chloroflexi bacterium]|nr:hypothetical protein [Chloroflexota bacterium]